MQTKRITLAITGASGTAYGLRLLECLLGHDVEVSLLISQAAHVVLAMESDFKIPGHPHEIRDLLTSKYKAQAGQLHVYGKDQWTAPIASGSSVSDAMVVCPCTSGSLAAIACGSSDNLLERAADVVLKEQKKLILVPREMPLSAIQLGHMLRLAKMGVVIMPASPGFYHQPQSISDLVDFVVARILDHLSIEHELLPRWGKEASELV